MCTCYFASMHVLADACGSAGRAAGVDGLSVPLTIMRRPGSCASSSIVHHQRENPNPTPTSETPTRPPTRAPIHLAPAPVRHVQPPHHLAPVPLLPLPPPPPFVALPAPVIMCMLIIMACRRMLSTASRYLEKAASTARARSPNTLRGWVGGGGRGREREGGRSAGVGGGCGRQGCARVTLLCMRVHVFGRARGGKGRGSLRWTLGRRSTSPAMSPCRAMPCRGCPIPSCPPPPHTPAHPCTHPPPLARPPYLSSSGLMLRCTEGEPRLESMMETSSSQ